MLKSLERGSCRRGRAAALAAAALLLLVQSFAAAHYHQGDPRLGLTHSSRIAEADALCAVCAFHFHSPTNSHPGSALPGAAPLEYRVAAEPVGARHPCVISRPSPRAPPLSA
ncbi:MAG: hypothetical protein ACREQD_16675 [Candidatus Binataceae bacterium]